jgi:hypothetical protein
MKMNPAECDQADCEAAALRQALAGLLAFCASPVLRRATRDGCAFSSESGDPFARMRKEHLGEPSSFAAHT